MLAIITSSGKGILRTESGLVGLSAPHIKVGDVVACLNGMFAPLVLRPEGAQYTIVGAARLAGFESATDMERYCTARQVVEAEFSIR